MVASAGYVLRKVDVGGIVKEDEYVSLVFSSSMSELWCAYDLFDALVFVFVFEFVQWLQRESTGR